MSDSEDKKVNCVICRKEFKRTAGAKDHIRRVHQNVGRVCNLGANCDRSRFKNRKCEVGKVIYTMQELEQHKELKHHPCEVDRCEQDHWTPSASKKCYKSKINFKTGAKSLECADCFKKLGSQISLKKHITSDACKKEQEKKNSSVSKGKILVFAIILSSNSQVKFIVLQKLYYKKIRKNDFQVIQTKQQQMKK